MPNQINWYPGHMARSRRLLGDQLKQVDAVIELTDARAPLACRNADLNFLTRGKARLVVLNKADLADDQETSRWLERFRREGLESMRFNANGGRVREMLQRIEQLTRPSVERAASRGIRKTIRVMVIGIPNVGKSTFINRLKGQKIADTGDRPGVTKSNRWIKIGPYLELLDTPGMLPPRLDDQDAARALAYLGSVRDQILDTEELAGNLLRDLMTLAPEKAAARFHLPEDANLSLPPEALVELACCGRGWLLSGDRLDTERGAAVILDEFRAGKIGKITLERAQEAR